MRRAQHQQLGANFFTRGGTIGRLPTSQPTAPTEVLEYLAECAFTVYPAPRGEGQPKYVFQGRVVGIEKLTSIANEQRALMNLPPLQLVPQH